MAKTPKKEENWAEKSETERLAYALGLCGGPYAAAKKMGKNPSSLYKYTRGEQRVGDKLLSEMEEKLGVQRAFIRRGELPALLQVAGVAGNRGGAQVQPVEDASPEDEIAIIGEFIRLGFDPTRGIQVYGPSRAGFPETFFDQRDFPIELREFLRITPDTVAVYIHGDSMVGEGLFNGDIVLVRENTTPAFGDVVAVEIDGYDTWVLKRFDADGLVSVYANGRRVRHRWDNLNVRVKGVVVTSIHMRKNSNGGAKR